MKCGYYWGSKAFPFKLMWAMTGMLLFPAVYFGWNLLEKLIWCIYSLYCRNKEWNKLDVSDILFSVSSRVSLQLIVRFLQSQNDLDFLNMAFIWPFIISSSFISTRPHRNFFCKHYGISIDYLLFVICYYLQKIKIVIFRTFLKK